MGYAEAVGGDVVEMFLTGDVADRDWDFEDVGSIITAAGLAELMFGKCAVDEIWRRCFCVFVVVERCVAPVWVWVSWRCGHGMLVCIVADRDSFVLSDCLGSHN